MTRGTTRAVWVRMLALLALAWSTALQRPRVRQPWQVPLHRRNLPPQPVCRQKVDAIPCQPVGERLYQPDHKALLDPVSLPRKRFQPWMRLPRVDAIVVPATRDTTGLIHAARAARAAARLLIIVCSRDCGPAAVRDRMRRLQPRVPVLIIDLDGFAWSYQPHAMRLRVRLRWETDTALKRNIGLLLARQLGLRHVLFLDDDVWGLTGERIRQAVDVLERTDCAAAAWTFDDFPDNSAVSHAYRRWSAERFGAQTCFAAGGGLLVKIDNHVPHFPLGIYNEDWLFLFNLLVHGRVLDMGTLSQAPYDPFSSEKASSQEFGDLLAEGLMTVLPEVRSSDSSTLLETITSRHFCERVLTNRHGFLDLMANDIQSPAAGHDEQLRSAQRSVEAAAQALAQIKPHDLRAWVKSWVRDAGWWDQNWQRLTPVAALNWHRPLRTESFIAAVGTAMGRLSLESRFTVLWPDRPALRHRIPEWCRAYVPRLVKDGLILAADLLAAQWAYARAIGQAVQVPTPRLRRDTPLLKRRAVSNQPIGAGEAGSGVPALW